MKPSVNSKGEGKTEAPYVGPRSFRRGETLYGRDQEIFDLTNRLMAYRVVLLHALSGAGKTSMINAGLITNLEAEGFRVLPVVRLKEEVDPAQMPPGKTWNRYRLSTLLSLEKERPEKDRLPLEKLVNLSLGAYLKRLPLTAGKSAQGGERTLLIFDQFEELLNLNRADIQEKKNFLAWLMPVLYDRRYWALFSMRDDFVGALEPYLGYFPNRMNARYRLEFLGAKAAYQAIVHPAKDWGVTFKKEAADELVKELRKIIVQESSGNPEGPYIEPIQLQVVCLKLWDTRRPDPKKITKEDVEKSGGVDRALSDYYDKVLKDVSGDEVQLQRNLRNWIERELITKEGLRGQSLQQHIGNYGLNEAYINRLIGGYLVRPEQRLNATWYELAHDRLVQPIVQANQRWREDKNNLLPWQLNAERWERDGGHADSDLLLKKQALAEAQASYNPGRSTRTDKEFLEASEKAILRAREIEIQSWADKERLKRVELGTNLDEVGWGVIFHQNAAPELKQALKELLDLRQVQAGAKRPVFFRPFEGPNGYRPGETAEQFLRRNEATSGLTNPEKMPYYLLIVGDPASIPYEFQYGLDQKYAVGRIYFETLTEYQSYARSVSVCEGGTVRLPNRAAIFSPRFPNDRTSQKIVDQFTLPLAEQLSKTLPNWQVETVIDGATRERLGALLGGSETPSILLAIGRGAGEKYAPERPEDIGSVICQGWPGPASRTDKVKREHYFSADDIDVENGRLLGQIAFLSNDYSAGIPERNEFNFSGEPGGAKRRLALARLPQRLLGHPHGGALAVIAHSDKLGLTSLAEDDQDTSDVELYRKLISLLMQGYTVGAAMELLNQRYARIAALLQERLQEVYFYQGKADRRRQEELMIRYLNARNFLLLGDPAVRLPVDPDQPYQEPGPDWMRPEISEVVPLVPSVALPPTPAVEEEEIVEGDLWYASGIDPLIGKYAIEGLSADNIVALLFEGSWRSELSQDLGSRRFAKS